MDHNSTHTRRALLLLLLLVTVTCLLLPAASSAARERRLVPAHCWEPAPGVSGTCADVPGMGDPARARLTRDGRSLLVLGGTGNEGAETLANFARDPRTGDLTLRQCFAGPNATDPTCARLPVGPSDLEPTSDGRSVYAIGSDGLLSFARDPRTGDLTLSGCLFDDYEMPAPIGCTAADAFGTPFDLIPSPDGRTLYVSGGEYPLDYEGGSDPGTGHDRLVSFRRNLQTGELTMLRRSAVPGVPFSLAVSPDGRSLYGLISADSNGFAMLRWTVSRNGGVRFAWCRASVTSRKKRKRHCRRARGLGGAIGDIALAPHARSLLAVSFGGFLQQGVRAAGIASYGLSPAGRLSFRGCVESSSDHFGPRCRRFRRMPIVNPADLTISPNGRWAYILTSDSIFSGSEGSVLILRLKPKTGKLSFAQCIASAHQRGSRCTYSSPFSIVRPRAGWQAAPSSDGSSLYVPSGDGIAGPPELLEFRAR